MSKPVVVRQAKPVVAPRSGHRTYRKGRAIGGGTTGGKEVVAPSIKETGV